eukprot:139828-Prymnesium_polylepis.1
MCPACGYGLQRSCQRFSPCQSNCSKERLVFGPFYGYYHTAVRSEQAFSPLKAGGVVARRIASVCVLRVYGAADANRAR